MANSAARTLNSRSTIFARCSCECFLHSPNSDSFSHQNKCIVLEKEALPSFIASQLCCCCKCTCLCTVPLSERPIAVIPPRPRPTDSLSPICSSFLTRSADIRPSILTNIVSRPPPNFHLDQGLNLTSPTINDHLSLRPFLTTQRPISPTVDPIPSSRDHFEQNFSDPPSSITNSRPKRSRRNRKNKRIRARSDANDFPCLLNLAQDLPPIQTTDRFRPIVNFSDENDQDSPDEN